MVLRAIHRDNPIVMLREQRGMTRDDVCAHGIPYATVGNLERGRINSMQAKTAERLAEIFGMGTMELIDLYQAYRETCKNKKPIPTTGLAATVEMGAN